MIEDLLPTQVVSVAVRGDDPSACLHPDEAAQIGWAVESRMREFTTARCCARRALCILGLPAIPILRGPQREPLWPSGVVGSITHCNGYRAAAVAMQFDMLTVGIDAEIHDDLPSGILEQVCVEQERDWLAGVPGGLHWDRLLFSAKESVYKAWFPLTGRWLGFEDVLVTFEPALRTFHAQLLVTPPAVAGRDLTCFTGRFLVRDGLVLTAIALPRWQSTGMNIAPVAEPVRGAGPTRRNGSRSWSGRTLG
jgi:enterobactin synthetase component D / holo-[acyl-carrier protein] synthase